MGERSSQLYFIPILFYPYLAFVSDHKLESRRLGRALVDFRFPPNQTLIDPASHVADLAPLENDAVLDFCQNDPAIILDGGERAYVGIGNL